MSAGEAGLRVRCSHSLDTSPREITRDRQFSPYPAKITAFTKSGHSTDLKTGKSTVSFRPIAYLLLAHSTNEDLRTSQN